MRKIHVGGSSVSNALCIVDGKDSGKQRIILSKNQSVVEVLQNFPSSLSNFVARKDRIDRYLEAIQTCTLLLSSLFDEAERGDSFTTRATPEVLSETVWFNDFQPT